jgi:hypothetical protein
LLSELRDDLFTTHIDHPVYRKTGSLRDGSSIWYHNKEGDYLNSLTCVETVEFIKRFANGRQVGRCYMHRMMPGTVIYPHNDQAYQYFFEIDRYQIFLDMPAGFAVQHKHQPQPNSVNWFDHLALHAYQNKSDQPVYFLVIDLFKP